MSTDHDHAHTSSIKTLLLALIITTGFAVVEAVTGWLANSLALIGDAGHMLTDSLSLAVGALAAWASKRPPTARLSYGWQRTEVLGALFNVIFMYAIVAVIIYAAIKRLIDTPDVEGGSVLLVGTLGLLVNIGVAWLLSRGEQTLNTRGAMLHVMGDLLGSVAAVGSGIVVLATGWMPIDPILSILICVLILVSSTKLLMETLRVVMAGVPPGLSLDRIRQDLVEVHPAIVGVHHLHVWEVSSSTRALSAHIEMDSLDEWQSALDAAAEYLAREFNIDHPTLQPELSCVDSSREGDHALAHSRTGCS
ncbi:cation transporter [bacterium]|nr:cation transporter [bacterium]